MIAATEFKNNAIALRSGALAYTVLLSLVPILAMSTAVVKGLGGDDQLRQVAYSYIETLANSSGRALREAKRSPVSAEATAPEVAVNLTDHLRLAIDQLFDYVDKTNFTTLGTIGVVGILLSVILVLSYIEEAMNTIWKVANGRSLPRKIADYLTLLILFPISINVAFAASAFLKSPVLVAKMDILMPFAWLQTLVLKAVPGMIITLTFYVIYIFFPNTKVRTFPALLGSILAALLWFGVQEIYISLQIGVAQYNAIYGSFATLPLFLVWIYLGWMFILTGAQVAFACQNIDTYELIPFSAVPSLKLGAAFDIMDCIYQAFAAGQPITPANLIVNLPRYGSTLIAEVASTLQNAGLLHVSQTDDRLLPASPEKSYDYQAVVTTILGNEAPESDGGTKSIRVIQVAAAASGEMDKSLNPGDPPQHRQQT
jgi:membrane protein